MRTSKLISRRAWLRGGVAGLGAAAVATLTGRARAASAGAVFPNMLVILELRGGNDVLNTFVPVTSSQYAARRPRLKLDSNQCLSMNAGPHATTSFMLHPALTNLQALWNNGELAVIHKVGYPQENLSHFRSLDIWAEGVRGPFAALGIPRSGWVARYADLHAPTTLAATYLGNGRPNALLGGTTPLFMSVDLSLYRFVADGLYSQSHAARLATVRQMLARGSTGVTGDPANWASIAHGLAGQVGAAYNNYTSSVVYSSEPLNKRLRDAAVMIQAGFGTRIFYTGRDGFDTHRAQGTTTGTHAGLLSDLDTSLAAFVQDMKNMGAWANTVILVVSEFGRRNYDNNSTGTDHGGATTVMALGGPVIGGFHGSAPSESELALEYLPYQFDFRSIYKEALTRHLGVSNPTTVFPEAQPIDVPVGYLT